MKKQRGAVLLRLARGLLTAVGVTLLGMLAMAVAILFAGLTDRGLTVLNQVLKLLAIGLGVWLAVGRGGERGLATGAAVAALYMVLGYACYCGFGGMPFAWDEMLTEILLGATFGAIFGAVLANLPARQKRPRARAARPVRT